MKPKIPAMLERNPAPNAETDNQIALRGGSLMRESPSLW